jgi:hypothetical protein
MRLSIKTSRIICNYYLHWERLLCLKKSNMIYYSTIRLTIKRYLSISIETEHFWFKNLNMFNQSDSNQFHQLTNVVVDEFLPITYWKNIQYWSFEFLLFQLKHTILHQIINKDCIRKISIIQRSNSNKQCFKIKYLALVFQQISYLKISIV